MSPRNAAEVNQRRYTSTPEFRQAVSEGLRRSWAVRKRTPEDRFWERVDASGDCWLWTGAKHQFGYGVFDLHGKTNSTHRIAYTWLVGPIPAGTQLDHLCRVPACVNPDHLEVVTPRINQLRGYGLGGVNARKTTCPRGHDYSGRDSTGRRICHPCQAVRQRRYRERKAA